MPKKNYIIRDPESLNLLFYQKYDEHFLFRKADTLMFILENFKDYFSLCEQKGGSLDEPEKKYLEGLRAEIHFTEIHQAEVLFGLMMSIFQSLPHWLYLTTYSTREIKTAITLFLNGDIKTLTDGRVATAHEFIQQSIYSGFVANVPEKVKRWEVNLENITWLLRRIDKKYIEAEEYNAYKHGLRTMTGETRLAIYPDNEPEQAMILAQSEDSLSFLETKDKGEGGLTVYETTKHFSHIESYNHIVVMHYLSKTIKSSRLARIKGEKGATIQTFFEIDKEKMISQSSITKWSFTV